jgi:hypothetical protein
MTSCTEDTAQNGLAWNFIAGDDHGAHPCPTVANWHCDPVLAVPCCQPHSPRPMTE